MAPGEMLFMSGVRFTTFSVLARQPPRMGESISTTPLARVGCSAAHIKLRKPPSEWPMRNTGPPARSARCFAKSASCCTRCGQLSVTGYFGSCPNFSMASTSKPRLRRLSRTTR